MRPSADTILVWTGGACSYGCAACPIERDRAALAAEPTALHQQLARAGAGRLAVLVGGEPLLRADWPRLLAAIRAAGCVPGLVTTGGPLLYPQWRERLRRAGLAYLRVQLFGSAAAHDAATALPGAFGRAMAGVRDWLAEDGERSCDVDLALSTRGRAADDLLSEIAAVAGVIAGGAAQIVVAVDPEHPADHHVRAAARALAAWNDDPGRPLLVWEGLADAPASPSAVHIAPPRPAFLGPSPDACCLGRTAVLRDAARPAAESPRANSFNYVRSGPTVPWTAAPEACTAYAAGGGDPRRQLWLVDGARLVLYTTDTGDFADDEIGRTKDVWSHLFLDRAPAGVLDDISEGMRRVLPDPLCDRCAQREACGRRGRVLDEPPFARQEEWIRAHVAALRGRVLDVGCGEQPYHDLLRPLAIAGRLAYTGLDPDPPSLQRARAALPEGRFLRTGIEEFRAAAATYDHILSLRSLNHVVDLDLAIARMAELLRPGGSLLLVECTPFAMLREPAQVAAADRAPRAGHQHFRNVASDEVVPLARRRGLVVREHAPSSFATTNQWLLLLERPQP